MHIPKIIPWVVFLPQVILLPLYFLYPSRLLLIPGILLAFLGTVLLLFNTLFFSTALLCLVIWVYNLLGHTPQSIHITGHMNSYFEKIRGDDAALTAFFAFIPKGADLHNHSSGTVYAEDFFQNAIDQQLYINLKTLELSPAPKGVDMAYEKDNDSLLHYMSQHHIAIEINLISNECILKVKDDAHPVMLYFDHQVPVTLSTDDAGIPYCTICNTGKAVQKTNLYRYPANGQEQHYI